MIESKSRSLYKTISWRIIATIASFIISYFVINDATIASSIAGIQMILHSVLYYFHERMWTNIRI